MHDVAFDGSERPIRCPVSINSCQTAAVYTSAHSYFPCDAGGVRALMWRTVDRGEGMPAHVAVYAIDLAVLHIAAGMQLEIRQKKLLKRAAVGPQVRRVRPQMAETTPEFPFER